MPNLLEKKKKMIKFKFSCKYYKAYLASSYSPVSSNTS